jgi:hypothetical protein
MENGNLVKTDLSPTTGPLCPDGHFPQISLREYLGEREQILGWCVDAGAHPNEDGWFMLFRFPNGLTATVAWTLQTDGIEVGVRNGDWLVDVIPNLSGDEIRAALEEVMRRSI